MSGDHSQDGSENRLPLLEDDELFRVVRNGGTIKMRESRCLVVSPSVETIRIPNRATRFPVALSDVFLAAPFASKLLLRSAVPGVLVGAAAAGAYVGSAARDWLMRRGVRPLSFEACFGVDVLAPPPMSPEQRVQDVVRVSSKLTELHRREWPYRSTRRERARLADEALTTLIARYTGQRIVTSTSLRSFMLSTLFLPFAVAACDRFSGEVGVFRALGIFEPHVIAHEFAHRKGYVREVDCQLLSYMALVSSSWREGRFSALAERLFRNLAVLSECSPGACGRLVKELGLPSVLESQFLARCGSRGVTHRVARTMELLYEARMRLTGQNGLSDYDEGFTNALHGIEISTGSRAKTL